MEPKWPLQHNDIITTLRVANGEKLKKVGPRGGQKNASASTLAKAKIKASVSANTMRVARQMKMTANAIELYT